MLEWPDAEDVHTIVGGISCGSQGLLDISVKCRCVVLNMRLVKRPLMGNPQCCMSILRNGNVACPCRLFSIMLHVEFDKGHVTCHYVCYPLSHVTKPYIVACRI